MSATADGLARPLEAADQHGHAMAGFFGIMALWGVGNRQMRRMFGAPPERTFYEWKSGRVKRLPEDTLRRIGYVAGIYKALQILYSDAAQADRLGAQAQPSLRRPDAARAHGGRRCDRSRGGARLPRCRPRALVLSRGCAGSAGRRRPDLASRYPPIDLFERVSTDPAVWDALIAAEALVNPRVRDEVGEINLVPPARARQRAGRQLRHGGVHASEPERLALQRRLLRRVLCRAGFRTALRETAHHFARFASDSQDGPRYEDMRVLVGRIDARLHDVASLPPAERDRILDPDSYAASQPFGAALRDAGSPGLTYPSVRDPGGQCAAAFRPKVVGIPVQTKHLKYHWDGRRVGRYFDYATESWHPVWP